MGKWAGIDLRICTELRNIPYKPEPDKGIHPVVWLTKEPKKIDDIPELRKDHYMKRLVLALNSEGGRFESFRCECLEEEQENGIAAVFGVGFIYRDRRAFKDYAAQLMIAGEILGFMADSDTFENMAHPYTIEIHRVRLKDEDLIGRSVDVWHQSVSSNLDSAKQLRANAIEFLTSVLSKAYP